MDIKYFERKGVAMFTLNGEPMSVTQRKKYSKECDLAVKKFKSRSDKE